MCLAGHQLRVVVARTNMEAPLNTKKVIVELQPPASLTHFVNAPAKMMASAVAPDVPDLDPTFEPVALPRLRALPLEAEEQLKGFGLGVHMQVDAREGTVVARADVPAGEDPRETYDRLMQHPAVVGVFADVTVQPQLICPGSPPLGTHRDVEQLLGADELWKRGMDGSGVTVAIVDTGVNMAYLRSRAKNPRFDEAKSWVPRSGLRPGHLPVGHGTMCAFDACIAAPRCTILDIALLQSRAGGGTAMEGFLSDGVRAYAHLLALMQAQVRPGENRSLVVNNSWGMFHPSWDYPVGHPGNYSDNPNHSFNRITASLAAEGADILFAAGNCGADCPDGRCRGVTTRALYGANSHPDVTVVAGVDVRKDRVGYSSIGPGRLERMKPDVAGFTHFAGSGVYSADGGTSAATPVVAGVVAALRTRRPFDPADSTTHPSAVRALVTSTAEDRGAAGYDFRYGWGVVDGRALARRASVPTDEYEPPPVEVALPEIDGPAPKDATERREVPVALECDCAGVAP